MRKQIPLVFCIALVFMVALSGCITPPYGPEYKNDVITVESYYVSKLNPTAGSPVTISFDVKNNGEMQVSRAEVDFFDVSGLGILSLSCDGVPAGGPSCTFSAIQSGEIRQVIIRLKTQDTGINRPSQYVISWSVDYDYTAYRMANIPIAQDVTGYLPSSKFSQSDPTYSPIRLDIEMPERGEQKIDNKVTKLYYAVRGEPFEITFKLSDVASSRFKAKQTTLAAGDIQLDTKGTLQKDTSLPCDFNDPDREIIVPGEMRCSFVDTGFTTQEKVATIEARYSFTYEYTQSETLTVQPVGSTTSAPQT